MSTLRFEKKFVVYSSEEASARKILSKEMIQKLLEFNQLYPGKFRVSIQPNAIISPHQIAQFKHIDQ